MSTQPPLSSADQLMVRGQAMPTVTKQLVTLLLGMAGASTIGGILGSVTDDSNPVWVLPVILAGMACFFGFLATSAWTMRSRLGQLGTPTISTGLYLSATLATGGLAAFLAGTPMAAYGVPFVLAALVAALSGWGRFRRAARTRHVDRLRSGARTMGTVTDDGLAVFAASPNQKIATLTVSFRDFAAQTRWVSVLALQTPGTPIQVGQKVDVWFDASDPGNAKKIVVEFDNGASRIIPGKVNLPTVAPDGPEPVGGDGSA